MIIPDKPPLLDYTHTMRSRYGETDKMGYVYYGVYLEYFEVARTEMVRSMQLSYADLEEQGVMLPVVKAELEYKQPVYYDEKMHIRVSILDQPTVRLHTYYQVWTDRTERSHVNGHVALVFMDRSSRRPIRTPDIFKDRFEQAIRKQQGDQSVDS